MTTPKKRGCLAVLSLFLFIVAVVVLGLIIIGLLPAYRPESGSGLSFPPWMTPKSPAIHPRRRGL